jgi:hypothetical protein
VSDTSALPTRVPPGTIVPWLGGYNYVASITSRGTLAAPGWLYCDGSAVLGELYPALYAAIQGVYGSAPTGYFYLPTVATYASAPPILRGTFVGAARSRVLGGHTHSVTATVNVAIADGGSHSHSASITMIGGGGSHAHVFQGANTSTTASSSGRAASSTTGAITAADDHTHYAWDDAATTSAGGPDHNHNAPGISVTTSKTHSHNGGGLSSNASATYQAVPPYVQLWHLIKT